MAGFKRPSFLKRQKEQKRLAKQAAKREERMQKKRARASDWQLTEPESEAEFLPDEDSSSELEEPARQAPESEA